MKPIQMAAGGGAWSAPGFLRTMTARITRHGMPAAARMLAMLLASLMGVCSVASAKAPPGVQSPDRLVLHYDRPAPDTPTGWEQQALPIGNGRLGAMLFGGVERDRVSFNDITLWTGDARQMGAYQPFGNVVLELPGHARDIRGYQRSLDVASAIHRVRYRHRGVGFERETFASHPDQVIVMRLTASRPGQYSGRVRLEDRHGAPILVSDGMTEAVGRACAADTGFRIRIRIRFGVGTRVGRWDRVGPWPVHACTRA